MLGLLFRAVLWLARWPSAKVALQISKQIAWVFNLGNGQTVTNTRINIATCFPELDEVAQNRLVKQSLQNMVLLFFEFAQLAYWPERRLLDQIQQVHGKELLDDAYASERGVILLVPHYGNWEILCAFLGVRYNFAALYDPPKLASLEQVILDARERFNGEMFPIDTGGMRSLFKVLRQGKLIAILPDQVPDRNAGVYANFFGKPALTMTLINRLVAKNDPVVLMGSVERVGGDPQGKQALGYQLRFESLPQALQGLDEQHAASVMNAAIEKVVRRNPAQYQWEYRRFKRPPTDGGPNIYRRQ